MVYVPILKIDLPEPRLEELIPGLVTVVVGACTLAFDAVYGFLHPLSPEGEQQIYEATLMNLPREFRKARKRVIELDIKDDDKIDEELDTAAYNFYRRRMREEAVGYSDEGPEDVTFRRLMSHDSPSRELHGLLPLETALLTQDTEALQQLTSGASSQAAAAAAVTVLPPPGRARRATTTAAVGGAGLALGAGVVKLVHLISSRLAKQRRKAKRRAAAACGQTGSRRGSEKVGAAAAAAAAAGARGSRRGSTGTAGTGRVTPRQR